MQQQDEQPRPVGRPPVGPKMQAAVPPEIHRWVRKRMRATRQKEAAIVRSLIIAGYEATRGTR